MRKHLRLTAQIKARDTSAIMMGDLVIALFPLCVMAFYYYGLRSAMLILTAAAVGYLADMAGYAIRGKVPNPKDLSGVVTGLVIVLMMPASVPYFIVVIGCLFAILVLKHPFGGLGNNPFNPAAGGFAFVAISFPQSVFTYPIPFSPLEVFGNVSASLVDSPAFTLKLGGMPTNDPVQMLLGNFPGPMGATHVLVILTCAIFLIYRRSIDWRIPLSFVAVSALGFWCFPRIVGGMDALLYELFSGTLLFGAFFILTEPVTSPKTYGARWLYGGLAGAINLLFRYYGGFEEGLVFTVLIINSLSHLLDRETIRCSRYLRRWVYGDPEPSKEAQK